MRENLIKENHSAGLGGHFGLDKTYELLKIIYFWPKLRANVQNFVRKCRICQYAKGRSQSTGL